MKRKAIGTALRKIPDEKAKTEAELRALEAGKAQLQQQRERQAARAHEEAQRRAVEALAAAMEGAGRKSRLETRPGGPEWTPSGGSSTEPPPSGRRSTWTRRTLGAAKAAAPPPVPTVRARGRPLKDHGGLPKGTPMTLTPSLPAAMGMDETAVSQRAHRLQVGSARSRWTRMRRHPSEFGWRGSPTSLP